MKHSAIWTKKVDLLSKGGFQFPKYTREYNTLLTCKWHPILRDHCSTSSWVTSEVGLWRWSFSLFIHPHLPTLFLTTTQKGIRTRLARDTKGQNWKEHNNFGQGKSRNKMPLVFQMRGKKMQNWELNFGPSFTWI